MTDTLSSSIQSPRISQLLAEMQNDKPDPLSAFWDERRAAGGPLFEPMPEGSPLAGTHMLVTFTWRAEIPLQHCLVVSALGEISNPETLKMEQLPGTDLWYRTYQVRRDIRLGYCFAPGIPPKPPESGFMELARKTRPDPYSTSPALRIPLGEKPEDLFVQSLLEGPEAVSLRMYLPDPAMPAGKLEKATFQSQVLANERSVWVYTPPGYDPQAKPYPLLLLYDGQAYTELIPTHTILDNLIVRGKIPPVVAVLPDSLDDETRSRELPCHAPFIEFLESEFVPWVRRTLNVSLNPARCVVAGSSYGGLAASWTALRLSHLFGCVLSQSGSYWWRHGAHWQKTENAEEYGWLTREYIASEKLPIRFYQEIGLLEHDVVGLGANRHFRDVLRARGYRVDYREYYFGHDYCGWRETLADGLISLFNDLQKEGENHT